MTSTHPILAAVVAPLLFTAGACTGPAQTEPEAELASLSRALGGREGKLEFAIDAPWRLEPVVVAGQLEHGAIPITVAIHDVNFSDEDGSYDYIRNFLGMRIEEFSPGGRASQHVDFDDLREVEATWGSWQLTGRPPHEVCEPTQEGCGHMRSLEGSSAWFATFMYEPETGAEPGEDIDLTITIDLEAGLKRIEPHAPAEGEEDALLEGPGTLKLRNHLRVHLGEAPLPRFAESGWLYGDLHYHSENTDNEGEAGYAYRGTVRAMGALGLDFAFATEHASNSRQITDVDLDFELIERKALRDMSPERFRFGLESLHGPRGANAAVLDNPDGEPAQTVRGHGVAPQLYLGGEVDAIPEISHSEIFNGVRYGNGLSLDVEDFCITAWCDGRDNVVESPFGGYGVVGWAGGREENTRQHIVYMPSNSSDRQGFVSSDTTKFGGGGRWLPDVLEDIEEHGYAFLAHPMQKPEDEGYTHFGPDMYPYSRLQLTRALRSPAILGLQLWNEDARMETPLGRGDSFNNSATGPTRLGSPAAGECQQRPSGALECLLEMVPQWDRDGFQWNQSTTPTFGADDTSFARNVTFPRPKILPPHSGLFSELHHGTFMLDELLRRGLNPEETADIPWLPEGEPRRFFIAGGSDAHGDLNYRREGYFFGEDIVSSTAIGTPRNLLFVGRPRPVFEVDLPIDGRVGSVDTDPGSGGSGAGGTITPSTGGGLSFENAVIGQAKFEKAKSAFAGLSAAPATTANSSNSLGLSGIKFPPGVGPIVIPDLPIFQPRPKPEPTPPRPAIRYSQSQVVRALRSGNFSVTDGPALRIVVDRNRNGKVDPQDVPMGGILNLYGDEDQLPLLVEFKSTQEFGPLANIDLYVGSVNGRSGRTYAPADHGVRDPANPGSTVKQTWPHNDGQRHREMEDGYFRDPTGQLRIEFPTSTWNESARVYEGVRAVTLDLSRFPSTISRHNTQGQGYYVRAFAKTEPTDWASCRAADRELFHRRGQCLEYLAFTNPVWAMRRSVPSSCADAERGLDRDSDGLPDYCDQCPTTAEPYCLDPNPGGHEPSDDTARRLGGTLSDAATCMAFGEDGSVFVGGHFQGRVDTPSGRLVSDGGDDGFLAKYSPEGLLQWVKQFGGRGDLRILDVALSVDGHPTVTGHFDGTAEFDAEHSKIADGEDVFVAQVHGYHFRDDPDLRWLRILSGEGDDVGTALAVDDDGFIHVGGSFQSEIFSGSGGVPRTRSGEGSDCFVVKLSTVGRHLETLHGAGDGDCEISAIAIGDEGTVVLTGNHSGELRLAGEALESRSGFNGFVASTRTGIGRGLAVDWTASIGDGAAGCSSSDTRAQAVGVDGSGELYVVGNARGCVGLDAPRSSLYIQDGSGDADVFLVRLSATGTPRVVRDGIGVGVGTGDTLVYDIAVAEDGSYVACGSFASSGFDLNGRNLPSRGPGPDAWVASYSAYHEVLTAQSMGGNGAALACDRDADVGIAVTGAFSGSLRIGDARTLTSAGASDAFLGLIAP